MVIEQFRPQRGLFQGNDDAPLGLDEYQRVAAESDRSGRSGIDGIGFLLLGLFGETGSVLSELKKKQRDKDAYTAYEDSVIEELGDVLWYFSNVALRAGLTLSGIAALAPARLPNWDYHGRERPTAFVELQQQATPFSGPLSSENVERRLLALAGKVGRLVEEFAVGDFAANRDRLSAGLVEVFRAILVSADDANVGLDMAARRNLAKIESRWPSRKPESWGKLFDETFPEDEQLPRRIEIVFRERAVGEREYVTQQCRGINIGDRLTDNRLEPDDYRFHDVFHLAYAAFLGWSPVMRALFRVKRKSDPSIDENEDGARAAITEEGISTWIFNHGVRHGYFESVYSLDYGLLKAIHELVKGYEVESRPYWQWERAILEGFRVFRELRKYRGGTVTADLIAHTLSFEPNR